MQRGRCECAPPSRMRRIIVQCGVVFCVSTSCTLPRGLRRWVGTPSDHASGWLNAARWGGAAVLAAQRHGSSRRRTSSSGHTGPSFAGLLLWAGVATPPRRAWRDSGPWDRREGTGAVPRLYSRSANGPAASPATVLYQANAMTTVPKKSMSAGVRSIHGCADRRAGRVTHTGDRHRQQDLETA